MRNRRTRPPRAPRQADRSPRELNCNLFHDLGTVDGLPRPRGQAGEIAQRRQTVVRKGGLCAGVMGNAFEQRGFKSEREATIALAVAMRTGEAMPGIDQKIGALGEQGRSVLVADDEASR